mmetsp:Transcript_30089/g.75737  ORF Transcript_30089/g.75737 Transcript_30089/m.75737 type:complete len:324 (+) Transcript_30089:2209-3180(+)
MMTSSSPCELLATSATSLHVFIAHPLVVQVVLECIHILLATDHFASPEACCAAHCGTNDPTHYHASGTKHHADTDTDTGADHRSATCDGMILFALAGGDDGLHTFVYVLMGGLHVNIGFVQLLALHLHLELNLLHHLIQCCRLFGELLHLEVALLDQYIVGVFVEFSTLKHRMHGRPTLLLLHLCLRLRERLITLHLFQLCLLKGLCVFDVCLLSSNRCSMFRIGTNCVTTTILLASYLKECLYHGPHPIEGCLHWKQSIIVNVTDDKSLLNLVVQVCADHLEGIHGLGEEFRVFLTDLACVQRLEKLLKDLRIAGKVPNFLC